ncbi:ABC transporter permease [Geodermatophilus sabuli]|uniref:ABC transporter permease n=1 Tax=Geodermatophilus sabuli TaxID=1564158 RepID=A0A7K3W288_9ACTN|nr:ABC transporter permease [Geodermatophilus sabuli]NEK58728.1 ABC transporter permease [Geodermatophilus sabuli]
MPPEPVRDARELGVIHDIGYRHYDGPRLGRAYIRRSLYADSAKGAYGLGRAARTKVMPMLLFAAMCVPTLVIVVVASVTGGDELPVGYTTYLVQLQVVVAVFVAAQAPVSVSRDLRFGIMPLYFSRPMRPVDYVQARYAALATAVFLLLAAPLTILFAGALLAEMPVGEHLPDYLRALVYAVLLAVVLAGLGLVLAAFTPRRGLGVAAIVAVLLVLSGVQTAAQAIAVEQGADTAAGYTGLVSPFSLVDGVTRELVGTDSPLPAGPPGAVGTLVFTAVTALVVLACYGVLLRRYRRVTGA